MKYGYVIAILALISTISGKGAASGKHLFILSGQSNMAGLDPQESFTPAVKEAFGEKNVIVVKDAQGGEPIRRWYKGWRSSEGLKPETTGKLYDRFMKKVNRRIKKERIQSVTFIWMQGEKDAREGHGDVYADSLKGLIEQVKTDLGYENINVVIGRISDFDVENEQCPHWTKVRKAQVKVAEENESAEWITTDDLNGAEDKLHYTEKGYEKLGKRFAQKAVALIREK